MDGRGFMFPVDTTIGKDGRMHTVSRAYAPATAQLRITMYDIDSEYFGIYGGYGEGLANLGGPPVWHQIKTVTSTLAMN